MAIQVELEGQLGFGIMSSMVKKGEVIMTLGYVIEQLKITRNQFFNYI